MKDRIDWECLECARVCNLLEDDYCPTCGRELPDERDDVPESLEGWPCSAGFAPQQTSPRQGEPR